MNKKIFGIFILILLIEISFLPCINSMDLTFSETIIIPDDYPTIQLGIDNANPGDIIFVRSGIYNEHDILIDKKIILTGENSNSTIIQGDGSRTILVIYSDEVIVSNFTIADGGNMGLGIASQNPLLIY